MNDCRLTRGRHRRRDSSVSSWKDLDALRRFVCEAVEDAGAAATSLGILLPRETPSRDQWWEWPLAVPATNIYKLLPYVTKADLWPEQQPSETSHARNAKRESEVKEASKYISSSGVGKAFAMRKQHHVQKPRQRCRDLGEAVPVLSKRINSPLDQIAMPMSAHHVATNLHSHRVPAQAPTTASIASDHTVSAPAQTNDSEIAATSAQLQLDGKRNDSDKLEHGWKSAVGTQRDPEGLRQKTSETSGRGKKI